MFTAIAGRTAIVTGASRGIGRGIALKLGSVGCNVLVISRSGEAAERVVGEIEAAGGTASAAVIDVGAPDQALRMAEVAIERYGTVDILCANAGIFPASKLDKMTAQEFDAVIGTNLRGTFLAVKACLPEMKSRRKGRIVLTSSITGPMTGYPAGRIMARAKPGSLASCEPLQSNLRHRTSRSTR
jgi:3-oxoacyl-[acyl-carrier protein] reductase